MVACSIRNCKNRSVKDGKTRFFSFPRTRPEQANAWLQFCKPKTNVKNGRVCSIHFKSSDYNIPLQYKLLNIPMPKSTRFLKPEAVPTLHLEKKENTHKSILKPVKQEVCEIVESTDDKPCFPDEYSRIKANEIVFVESLEPISEEYSTVMKSEYDDHSYCQNGTSGNDSVDEGNTTTASPAREIGSSSKQVERSDEGIIISKTEYKKLAKAATEYNTLKNNLKTVFTRGQMRCLMKIDKRRVIWSEEDINAAFSLLRNAGPKAYAYLKTSVGIPLPSFSTLRKWSAAASKET